LSEGESDEWGDSHGQTRRTVEKFKDGETCRSGNISWGGNSAVHYIVIMQ